MNTRLTSGTAGDATMTGNYALLASALGRVSVTLQASRCNLQQLVEKIHGDSTCALSLPEERKRCMETVLEFRLTISDLIESFWESSGRLAARCNSFRRQLEVPENRGNTLQTQRTHEHLIREILYMNHQSQVLLAQICVIQQAISICDKLFVSILERGASARVEVDSDPDSAIGDLHTDISLSHQPVVYAGRIAEVLSLRMTMANASDDLLLQIAGGEFLAIPEAVRHFEASTQALYGGLSALGATEPTVH